MKLIPVFIYLLFLGLYQVIFRDLIDIYGVTINLAAFLVLAVALYKSEVMTMWFGFLTGLVLSAGNPNLLGWQALVLALLGIAAYNIKERLNLDSLYTKLLLIFGGVLVHNIISLIIESDPRFYLLWANILFGAIYTSLLALFFFWFKEGYITLRKIKSIF